MCADCEARRKLLRDAWMRAKVGEALKHAAKGAAEAAGLKEKTGAAELRVRGQEKKLPSNNTGVAG